MISVVVPEPPMRTGERQLPALPDHMALSFEVFVTNNLVTWVQYAHLHAGDIDAAEEIIDEVATQLYEVWPNVLAEENVERYALQVLKAAIVRWLAEHRVPQAFVATSAFHRAMRESRRRFDLLEESIGLYSEISLLPERQYMVIVLRYVLGYDDERVAALLGVQPSTVRSHAKNARKRLARELHIGHDEDTKGSVHRAQ